MDEEYKDMFSERDILAVCFGLQQFFSKDSLHLEKNCCKASQTFGQKSLIVAKTYPCIPLGFVSTHGI